MPEEFPSRPLDFPNIPVGALETPPDLTRLLYKGGAKVRADFAMGAIKDGLVGMLRAERLSLVYLIHEVINGKLEGGGSTATARNQIKEVAVFFAWADEIGATLTKEEAQTTFLTWAEHLYVRSKVDREISMRTAYTSALRVGQVLDTVLERKKPILRLTRLIRPKQRKAPLGVQAEKQNLHDTFTFGHLLQDVCDGLTLKVLWGPLKVELPRQNGGVLKLWTAGSKPKREEEWANWQIRAADARRLAYEKSRSLDHRGRKALVNTRVIAELLMFIGQTGMNLAQAFQLTNLHFSYASDIDGYKVRDYKHRRGGEVLFEIFSEYRSHFERYLEWRRNVFPNSEKTFPVIREGSRESRTPRFDLIIALCNQADVRWTPPSILRGTRVNWLLRRSGDPDLTAEIAQHHKEVLLDVYDRPSFQRTIGEVTRFWHTGDPTLVHAMAATAVAPGACDGKPVPISTKPETAPSPDCIRPSGCLWCEHHRDIDTLDYVWSLASFRHLKILEMGKHCSPVSSQRHPAQHAIDRMSEKLSWFKSSNAARRSWVEEALARIEEGSYHNGWARLIQSAEGLI